MVYETLTTVFGWMTVLNMGFLALATLMLLAMQDWIVGIHARLFKMEQAEVRAAHYRFLAQYKVATLIFALVPYVALKLA